MQTYRAVMKKAGRLLAPGLLLRWRGAGRGPGGAGVQPGQSGGGRGAQRQPCRGGGRARQPLRDFHVSWSEKYGIVTAV